MPQPLRRVGIIGDVHTEDAFLDATLRFLRSVPALDALLCTGDIVTGPGDPTRCCALLADADVLTVRGNHDRWFFTVGAFHDPTDHFGEDVSDDARAFLAALPPTRAFDTPRGRLLLCHGLGDDDMAGVYPGDTGVALEANHRLHALVRREEFAIVVNGHTHRRMRKTIDGTLTILNAGTLRRDHGPGFLVADLETGGVECYNLTERGAIVPAEILTLP